MAADSNSPADVHHRARGRYKIRLADVVPRFLVAHHRMDVLDQFVVARARAHPSGKVVVELREQAGAYLSIGRHANTRAVSAEGMRHRRDDADLGISFSVRKNITARSLARTVIDLGD